ncbi:MAG: alkaline phosphatase family protein [Candidatus Acidiferrales bacterium]
MKRALFLVCGVAALSVLAMAEQRASMRARDETPSVHGPRVGEYASPIHSVIFVTVDGLMPACYTDPAAHGLKLPTLEEMVQHGAYSPGMQPVMPTLTYPSHTSLATGDNPGTHGIVTNGEWDPLGKNMGGWRWYAEDIRVPTLWSLAHAHGLKTAIDWWPVTNGAAADLRIPEYWRASNPEDLKLLRALSTPSGVMDEVAKRFPDFYENFIPPAVKDVAVADIATYAIETLRPNLLLVHLPEVDHAEHEKGPWSPEADAAMENADKQIARIIAAAKKSEMWEHSALVVASDHGFAAVSRAVRPGVLLAQKGLVTLDDKGHVKEWKAYLLSGSGMAYIYLRDKNDTATAQALLEIFAPLAGKAGSGIRRIAHADEIVQMGGDPQAFLALDAADDFMFEGGYAGDYDEIPNVMGMHGYFPEDPEMRASLLIYGPEIAPEKIEGARMIDVAPTIARWLGLKLQHTDGKALAIPLKTSAER